MEKLSDSEITSLSNTLPNWKLIDKKYLSKTLTLNSFSKAADLTKEIAKIADKLDHHPEIEIFDYKKLKIKITTHKVGGLTNKDIELAKEIEIFINKYDNYII